ncbi:MAG TPA: hypothetical protein VJ765_09395 [Chitinophagaceae bacterium]|nr:hypothetical protein [Chitinophagaceae bacterium]
MKKEQRSFFGNLFGAKGRSSEIPVTITSYSQPHVLQQRMREEKLTHGETVMANLSPVRLENSFGNIVMYFCPLKTIEVLSTSVIGDGGEIPRQAVVEGLKVRKNLTPGLYTLKNVQLSSNGCMQVLATRGTEWELESVEF